jgi:hypothetical protein
MEGLRPMRMIYGVNLRAANNSKFLKLGYFATPLVVFDKYCQTARNIDRHA